MPYFSYISCLHLYESLGWWRAAAELRKVHFAEVRPGGPGEGRGGEGKGAAPGYCCAFRGAG